MKLKRILASLLAAALSVASPLTSLAGSVPTLDDNASGNDTAGTKTYSGGDFSVNVYNTLTSGKIGIRITLVDKNDPSIILSVDDNGNPRVVDLLYVTEEAFAYQTAGGYMSPLSKHFTYMNPKTRSLATYAEGNYNWRVIYYDEVNAQFPDDQNMEPWIVYNDSTSQYVSNGSAFVTWCRENNYGVEAVGGDGNLYTVTVDGTLYQLDRLEDGRTTTTTETASGGREGVITTGDYSVSTWYNALKEDLKNGATSQYTIYAYINFVTEIQKEISDKDSSYSESTLKQWMDEITDLMIKNGFDIKAAGKQGRQSAGINTTAGNTTFSNSDIDSFNGSSFGSPSGEDDDSDTTDYQSHMLQLLQRADSNSASGNLFQTPKMVSGEVSTLREAYNAGENWVALVEPVIWLTIFPEGIDSPVVHTKMYGTITNFTQAFMTDSLLAKYRDNKSFNWKSVNQPVWWALTVNEGGYAFDTVREDGSVNSNAVAFYYPTEGVGSGYRSYTQLNKDLTQAKKTSIAVKNDAGEESTHEYNAIAGWGVNIYSAGDFVETEVQMTDTPLEDTSKITDPVKVAKWYVARYYDDYGKIASEKTIDVSVNTFDRTKEIAIVNETVDWTDDAIFDVQAWSTGKSDSVPSNGDTSSTYDTYASKSPGTLSGNTPIIVDMSTVPDEKTIYIKLVYEMVSEPGDITVIKIKEPSSGDPIIEQDTASGDSYDPTEKDAESCAVCFLPFAVRKKSVLSVIKLVMKGNAFITSLFNHGVLVA